MIQLGVYPGQVHRTLGNKINKTTNSCVGNEAGENNQNALHASVVNSIYMAIIIQMPHSSEQNYKHS